MNKKIIIFIALFAILNCFFAPFITTVSATDTLCILSVTQISDTEALVKFSEPVAINLNGYNRGPYVALRLVTGNDDLVWEGDVPMQYAGTIMFADSTHDTIVFKYGNSIENITTLLNFEGSLSAYKGQEQYKVKLCFEEVPFGDSYEDGHLDNITTLDGKTLLSATKPFGWEGCYYELDKDFSVTVDKTKFEDCYDPDARINYGKVFSLQVIERPEKDTAETESEKIEDSETDITVTEFTVTETETEIQSDNVTTEISEMSDETTAASEKTTEEKNNDTEIEVTTESEKITPKTGDIILPVTVLLAVSLAAVLFVAHKNRKETR